MSIEYKLYQMASINHIIIPIVGSKQSLEEQNIFGPSALQLTPTKNHDLPELHFWKKSMSAFKKFRDKKERRDKKQPTQESHDSYADDSTRPFYKLLMKTPDSTPFAYPPMGSEESPLLYFDPNEAPLYQWASGEGSRVVRVEKTTQEYHQIKLEKIQSSIIEEEPAVEAPEIRPDDPFIIVRKDHRKGKIKTKPIKKEKQWSHDDIHKERREIAPSVRASSDEDGSRGAGKQKSIQTLQQLMAEANTKRQTQEVTAKGEIGGAVFKVFSPEKPSEPPES